ncbi:MAG: glycosyl hydrolase family 18 protein [Clostridium sp.]
MKKVKKIILGILIAIVAIGGFYLTSKLDNIGKNATDNVTGESTSNEKSNESTDGTTLQKGKGNVVTYFPGWAVYSSTGQKYEVKDIPWNKVTHITHAFFEVKENGEIASTDKWSDFENTAICPEGEADWTKYPQTGYPEGAVFGHFGAYKYYKEKYPDVKVLIAVGGWTRSNNFHEVAKSSEKRKTMAKSMVELMKQYPFIDGFDIDWEYPGESRESSDQWDRGAKGGEEDKENFTLLLKDIRETFDSSGMKDKLLTVAVSADPKKIANTAPDKYYKYVDYIGVMTYDFAGAWDNTTGHLASISSSKNDPVDGRGSFSLEATLELLSDKYKVPKNKIYGGSPLYSRGWGDVAPGKNGDGLYQSGSPNYVGNLGPGGQFRWFEVKKFESDSAWKKYRDKETKVPYLYNSSTKNFLTYEDEESLKERCNYLTKNGYGGMIIWDASGDDTNGYPMHSIAFEAFGNKVGEAIEKPKDEDKPKDESSSNNNNNLQNSGDSSNSNNDKPTGNTTQPNSSGENSGTWKVNKSYNPGDIVTFNGKSYKCIQGHTSQETWDPGSAPALWGVE